MQKLLLALGLVCLLMPGIALALDSDGDSLTDEVEVLIGSNKDLADSDGDGYQDGVEFKNSYSPTSIQKDKVSKKIVIDLKTQTLDYLFQEIKVASYKVSTGKNNSTPKGEFKIKNKFPKAWSKVAKLWMPYWMAITNNGRIGLHELPIWPGGKREGEDHLGSPVSGGCVRLGVGAAKQIYDWTEVGTKVIIK